MDLKNLNCKAVTAFKIKGDGILSVAVEIEIKNGKVVSATRLNPPNLPAASMGMTTKYTWKHFREQDIEAD